MLYVQNILSHVIITLDFGNTSKLFTLFSEEDDLTQEADVAGMVRSRCSNLVTYARAWFSLL